jgi:hypothetical protein
MSVEHIPEFHSPGVASLTLERTHDNKKADANEHPRRSLASAYSLMDPPARGRVTLYLVIRELTFSRKLHRFEASPAMTMVGL